MWKIATLHINKKFELGNRKFKRRVALKFYCKYSYIKLESNKNIFLIKKVKNSSKVNVSRIKSGTK